MGQPSPAARRQGGYHGPTASTQPDSATGDLWPLRPHRGAPQHNGEKSPYDPPRGALKGDFKEIIRHDTRHRRTMFPASKDPIALTPPRPDGGTRFGVKLPPSPWSRWSPDLPPGQQLFAQLIEDLREPETLEEEQKRKRMGMQVVYLPIGDSPMAAQVEVFGTRREMVKFYVPDRVWIRINTETGNIALEFKTKELWSGPWVECFEFWMCGLHEMLTGQRPDFSKLHEEGWRCTRLELCCDFVGLLIGASDRDNFLSRSKITIYDKTKIESQLRDVSDEGEDENGVFVDAETIQIGSRAGNVSICVYNKTKQVNVAKRGANACNYVATWQATGWDGEIDPVTGRIVGGEEIRRVEVRFSNRGLELIGSAEKPATKATGHNLRDPAQICNMSVLAEAWAWATHSVRLIDPKRKDGGGTVTRKRRCDLDPRWKIVQRAPFKTTWPTDPNCTSCKGSGEGLYGGMCECVSPLLKQSRRLMEDAHAEKVRRAVLKVGTGLAQIQALTGVQAHNDEALAAIACFARDKTAEHGVFMGEYRDRYALLLYPFVGEEISTKGRPELLKWLSEGGERFRLTDAVLANLLRADPPELPGKPWGLSPLYGQQNHRRRRRQCDDDRKDRKADQSFAGQQALL